MKKEKFRVGQLVVFRHDWVSKEASKHKSNYEGTWRVTGLLVGVRGESSQVYLDGKSGSWTDRAITAYAKPPILDEELFTI